MTSSTDVLHSRNASTLGAGTLTVAAETVSTDRYSINDALLALASNATYTNLGRMLAAQKGTDYDPDAGKSRYLAAKLESFQLADQMEAAKDSDMFSTLEQFGGINAGVVYNGVDPGAVAERVTKAAAIKKVYKNERDKQVVEDADARFKEERAETDRAAKEAQAPKDAEGNPIVVDGHDAGSSPRAKDAAGNPVAEDSNGVESLPQSAGKDDGAGQDAEQAGQIGQADTGDGNGGQSGEGAAIASGNTEEGAAGSKAQEPATIGDASLAMAAMAAQRYATAMGAVDTGRQGAAASQTGGAVAWAV